MSEPLLSLRTTAFNATGVPCKHGGPPPLALQWNNDSIEGPYGQAPLGGRDGAR